jgi:hypothetical protein
VQDWIRPRPLPGRQGARVGCDGHWAA